MRWAGSGPSPRSKIVARIKKKQFLRLGITPAGIRNMALRNITVDKLDKQYIIGSVLC
jgi:hypothetical protein